MPMASAFADSGTKSEPTPWRKNRYAHMAFLHPTPSEGTIDDAFGRRTIVAPLDLLADITAALTREVGDAAAEILQKIGATCGTADMQAFAARSADEFGAQLAKVHMGVALQTWWWPWMAAGWGMAKFDFERAAQRLMRIDVTRQVQRQGQRAICTRVCSRAHLAN
jgi:hypothetical protein